MYYRLYETYLVPDLPNQDTANMVSKNKWNIQYTIQFIKFVTFYRIRPGPKLNVATLRKFLVLTLSVPTGKIVGKQNFYNWPYMYGRRTVGKKVF